MIFGVWGGVAPGGWCLIDAASGYWGTEVQAAETAAILARDYPESLYNVVPFDAGRLPRAETGTASRTQADALSLLERGAGHDRYYRETSRRTRESLMVRGWVFHFVRPDGKDAETRVTPAGRAAMSGR